MDRCYQAEVYQAGIATRDDRDGDAAMEAEFGDGARELVSRRRLPSRFLQLPKFFTAVPKLAGFSV